MRRGFTRVFLSPLSSQSLRFFWFLLVSFWERVALGTRRLLVGVRPSLSLCRFWNIYWGHFSYRKQCSHLDLLKTGKYLVLLLRLTELWVYPQSVGPIFFFCMALFHISLYRYNVESVGKCRESQFSSEESNFGLYNLNNPLRYLFQEFTLRNPQALYISRNEEKFDTSHKNVGHRWKPNLVSFWARGRFCRDFKGSGFFFELERLLRKKNRQVWFRQLKDGRQRRLFGSLNLRDVTQPSSL